jgi:SH3 domain-containing protein
MGFYRLACLGLVATLGACATAGTPPPVNLAPARAALNDAMEAGAPKASPDSFNEAERHLKEAERLAAMRGKGARDRSIRAEGLVQLATAEAHCAATAARLASSLKVEKEKRTSNTADVDRLNARLRRSEEDQRRLEERVVLLLRDLELTETEIIRTKARLKGIETRAEASSAIAEARILAGRLDPKARAVTLSLCNENIAKAEQQLTQVNYGAAVFFAMKAQDIAKKAQEGNDASRHLGPDDERPSPQTSYRVKAKTANIRKGPDVSEDVVAEAPEGSVLEASAVKGDWLKVTYNGTTGWVPRSLVE